MFRRVADRTGITLEQIGDRQWQATVELDGEPQCIDGRTLTEARHAVIGGRAAARGYRTRLHDLRHAVATAMLDAGESVHDVAGQLGNTPAMIEATYRHWLPGRGRESVERRAARFDERGRA